jgi:hypothetical protein
VVSEVFGRLKFCFPVVGEPDSSGGEPFFGTEYLLVVPKIVGLPEQLRISRSVRLEIPRIVILGESRMNSAAEMEMVVRSVTY